MPTLRERYQGTLVGVLAGDSLGAPYEKWEPRDIADDIDRRGGLVPFDYEDPWGRSGHFPAGRPTDDSELTAALAQSLIACNGSDPAHQYRYFKRAVGGQSFVWEGKADGFGRTTRKMLLATNYEKALLRDDRPSIPSNGSLMRSAPLALWFYEQDQELRDSAVQSSSEVTHIHPHAVGCCVIYCKMLTRLLNGTDPEEAWREACWGANSNPEQRLLINFVLPPPEATNLWMNKGGKVGSALHTLHIAGWCLVHAKDFREGIEMAVRFAGDTDTAAAVTGGLLGAYFGIEGIPQEWRDVLKGQNRMIDLANQLYDLRSQ